MAQEFNIDLMFTHKGRGEMSENCNLTTKYILGAGLVSVKHLFFFSFSFLSFLFSFFLFFLKKTLFM